MIIKTAWFWLGLILFLVGGAVLAFSEGTAMTGLGTTLGIVGVGSMVWAWVGRRDGESGASAE